MSHLADQLSALVDGELSGTDLDRANAHLAGCAECRAEAAALRRLKSALRALGEADDPRGGEALTDRLLVLAGPGGPVPSRQHRREQYRAARMPRVSGRGPRRGRRHGRYLAWSVASLMVMGLGATAFGMGGGGNERPVLEMQYSPQLKTASAEPAGQATRDRSAGKDKAARATRRQATGMRLLSKAATAGQATSYQGVELLSEPGVSGADVTTVTQVQHPGGGAGGVFWVTKALVTLLGRHYTAVYQGSGVSAGRTAFVIELHRFDGSLAARFWLDRQTLLPLRREVFDTSARLVCEDAFIQVRFGMPAQREAIAAQPARAGPLWSNVASPVAFLAALRRAGWRLPGTVAGGLPLYTAARSRAASGEKIDLGYSDGLFVISLTAQRGTLAAQPAGWQPASLNGRLVYVSGRSITWAAPGFVYTLTADAPPQAVASIVAGLPDSGPAGFFGRLRQGLDRLAALVNPFG